MKQFEKFAYHPLHNLENNPFEIEKSNLYDVWYFHKGQVRPLHLGPSAAARMGQGAECRGQNRLGGERCGQDRLGQLPLGKLNIWEVATWENTLGKLLLGKNPLGKQLISLKRYKITNIFKANFFSFFKSRYIFFPSEYAFFSLK